MTEKVKQEAAATLQFLSAQGVELKIVSGDSARTVASVARKVAMFGVEAEGAIIDARTLRADHAIEKVADNARIFGRATPTQKRDLIDALQAKGRTVAMVGDGVNDVLAIKSADLGIAMGNGSDATRAVAQLVLVAGDFATLPGVVVEGRRVIANVERVAKLFLTKTVYAAALAIASGVAELPFPFLPRQLTLITALTIGIPGSLSAFAADAPKAKAGLLRRTMRFAIPAGSVAAIASFLAYAIALHRNGVSVSQARTASTLTLGLTGVWIVAVLVRPLTKQRDVLLGVVVALGIVSSAFPVTRRFWDLQPPPPVVLMQAIAIAVVAVACIEGGWRWGATQR